MPSCRVIELTTPPMLDEALSEARVRLDMAATDLLASDPDVDTILRVDLLSQAGAALTRLRNQVPPRERAALLRALNFIATDLQLDHINIALTALRVFERRYREAA